MDEPVRGEFWRTRLNMDPRDPAYDAGTPSAQMAETAGFTLVISRDSHNQESEFITVVPRTSSARFIWGGVRSPCGDGGCDKEALIDCAAVGLLVALCFWSAVLPPTEAQLALLERFDPGADAHPSTERVALIAQTVIGGELLVVVGRLLLDRTLDLYRRWPEHLARLEAETEARRR